MLALALSWLHIHFKELTSPFCLLYPIVSALGGQQIITDNNSLLFFQTPTEMQIAAFRRKHTGI